MRYLVIYEDGSVFQTNNLTDDENNNFSMGYIDNIIDMKTMTSLQDDLSWEPIQKWK